MRGGVGIDPSALRRFRYQLIPDQQDGAERDCRIRDVERGPVKSGHVPLDEIDHGAKADAVDNVAQGATEHHRQG